MRPWIIWFVALLTVVSVIELGCLHPFGDPRVEPAKGLGTLLRSAKMPADAKAVLVTKCADCHSSETRWRVYARIAPGSWLIERDIVEARKKMDLSRWEQLPEEKQKVLTGKIIQEIKSGEMPPLQYLALHWDAKISNADVQALSMLGESASGSEAALAGDGDAVRGKAVFEKRCTGCHTMDVDREGPRLAGVYGRKAGSVPGFTYSAGLKNFGQTWNDATLERWLSDPDMMVPDNNMSFSVPKAEERRDLIAYLKQAKVVIEETQGG
jgi:cytochrome c